MRNIFKDMTLIVFIIALAGCTRPLSRTENTTEKFEVSKYTSTCLKEESTQELDEKEKVDLETNKIVLSDKIETKNFEILDCKDKVKKHGAGPARSFTAAIQIPAPDLASQLRSVEIESARTCSLISVDALSESLTGVTGTADKKSKYKINANFNLSEATKSGELKLLLTDSATRSFNYVNIADGKNVLEIRYLGEKSEVLLKTKILVELQVERKKVDVVQKVKQCAKGDKKAKPDKKK